MKFCFCKVFLHSSSSYLHGDSHCPAGFNIFTPSTMFRKKLRNDFHISTAHFYVVGEKNEAPSKFASKLRSSLTRPGYRSAGVLVAL